MGYYVQTGEHLHGKADIICQQFDGLEISQGDAEKAVLAGKGAVICVVDNGPFEAAAYCHSPAEFREFSRPEDDRPKRWVYVEDVARIHAAAQYP